MSHPFGDLVSQHLHRKHGLSQSKLAAGILQAPTVITGMCKGRRLIGPQARERVVAIIRWLHEQGALDTLDEASAMLNAAGMAGLNGRDASEAALAASLKPTSNQIAHAQPTRPTRRHNLPAQLTSFVGREHEIEEITSLLRTTRLLTLTGAGGVGKTRLALEAAADVVDQYPDGVWLITLASVTDPKIVVNVVAAVFDLREVGHSILTLLRDYLHDKHALIVLDNCEHLIQTCAELAESLLSVCPGLRILATSRESMNIPGEMVWRVPSLATDEAVQLFEARALEAIPESALTDADTITIAKICERLDGIPLAIELAASRLRVYSLAMIADRLDDRFKLLTGGARTALPRHQTLRALIDWSYDLLSADEQRLLRYLSVFAGGWTLEAAESVGEGMDVLSVLPQLVNKSLVIAGERAGQRRYTMLETIRQFGTEKLDEHGEVDVAYERMTRYLTFVGRTIGRRSGPDLLKLVAEQDNVRACIAWARIQSDPTISLRMVNEMRYFQWDSLAERLAWLSDALARGTNAPTELRLDTLTSRLAMLYLSGYHLSGWSVQAEEYLALSEQIDNHELTAEVLFWTGLVAWHQQKYDRVVALYTKGLTLTQNALNFLKTRWGLGAALAFFYWGIGLVQMKKGNSGDAARLFRQSLQAGQEGGNGSAIFMGLSGYAWMDARAALVWCEQEIVRLREAGSDFALACVLQAYTQPLLLLGQYTQVEAALRECLTLWHRLGVHWEASTGSAQALLDLGQVAWLQNDPASARAWYEQSLDEYSQVGDRERIARLHVYIGLTRLAQRNLEIAEKDFQISLSLYRELEQPAGIALALAVHARLAEAHGQMELAARLFGTASVPQELLAVSILWPASPVIYQREIAEARERFAETDWMQHWREGERMTHGQAIALISDVPTAGMRE